MHLVDGSFSSVCSFIEGFDVAHDGGVLVGFREWLLTGGESWTNLHWSQLVRLRANRHSNLHDSPEHAEEPLLLATLKGLLLEFSRELRTDGLFMIFHRYNMWMPDDAPHYASIERTRRK
ncbi:MAG: hypothetical protein JST00_17110 [Deltaproteobacteria bacterium]|nr:hypothetical protein [Deltaproteobacteria bacterium]